jgi:hypothetical protein
MGKKQIQQAKTMTSSFTLAANTTCGMSDLPPFIPPARFKRGPAEDDFSSCGISIR